MRPPLFDGPVPARRLAYVRAAICAFATIYVTIRSTHLWAVTRLRDERFDPIGVVSIFLDSPTSGLVVGLTIAATVVTGVGASLGWRFRWTGPAFALLLLWVLSYRLSWGQVLHTENLMVLHVLVLGFSPSADAFSLDSRHGAPAADHRSYGWALQLMTLLTALTYVIAAWAKIRNGGLDWMTGETLRNQIAYDNLRKHLLGDVHSAIGGWLTRYGWLFPPLATVSMVVEVGALAAVPRSRLREVWVAAAWLFHVGVLVLMAILFPYQLFGLAFLSLLPLERYVDQATSRRRARGRRREAGPALRAN